MAGEWAMWVAKQMGHTDWTFTARTYSRWIPDDAPEAGNKAVALWSPSGHSAIATNCSIGVMAGSIPAASIFLSKNQLLLADRNFTSKSLWAQFRRSDSHQISWPRMRRSAKASKPC
jgi:hypothetical protein